jgi:cysteinyl-tRNA synthetase
MIYNKITMSLKLYNTLTRKKEKLEPIEGKKINLFVCGPTVYDSPHIGHVRTYIAFDMITKYLRNSGYEVFYLQNITDIDDKIINRAKENGVSTEDLSAKFEKEYVSEMKELKIDAVSKYAKATDFISEIISQVERLIEKGFAYQIADGVYYDISKFKDYGKLSGRTVLQAEDGVSRIDEGIDKKNKGDFCLWKISKPGEPEWNSPWGKGRPGWHIEDTAITEKIFGPQYDIHGGARDLIFPHHEAEIAQIEAISGKKPFVKYWMHTGFLTINGQKMSKSLKNFITVRDFILQNNPRVLRMLILKNHYRSPIDYSEKEIIEIKKQLERIDEFTERLNHVNENQNKTEKSATNLLKKTKKDFGKAMQDDFNTPGAFGTIFTMINKGNALIDKGKMDYGTAQKVLEFFNETNKFFEVILPDKIKESIPKEILELSQEREQCRKQNLWKKSDELRQKIKELGYQVEDTKDGPKIKKI